MRTDTDYSKTLSHIGKMMFFIALVLTALFLSAFISKCENDNKVAGLKLRESPDPAPIPGEVAAFGVIANTATNKTCAAYVYGDYSLGTDNPTTKFLPGQMTIPLKEYIKILNANPKIRARVAGYTSAKGTQEYNYKLSERRAEVPR